MTKLTELEENKQPLSAVSETTARQILKEYLIEDRIYDRRQEMTSPSGESVFIYLDLSYILVPVTDKIMQALSVEDRKNAIYTFNSDKWKYIHATSIPRTFKMNEEFINQIDGARPKEISIKRSHIEKAMTQINSYYEAVLKFHIYKDEELKYHGKGLLKHQHEINKLAKSTRWYHLQKALNLLAKAVIRMEGKKK